MIAFLGLIPARDWLYLIAIAALLAAAALFVSHERTVGAAKVEAVRQAEHASMAAVAASASASAAAETNRRQGAILEIVNDTQTQAARVASDAVSAAAARDALRVQLAAVVRASRVPGDSAAAPGGSAASDPIGVLSDVLGRADDRATDLARLADERGTAGAACERSFDALTKP